jgi:choline dehydrogenase
VLVLEAGGTDHRFFVQMPLGYGKCFLRPRRQLELQDRARPRPRRQCRPLAARQGVGGSSSINAMVWIRGHPADYDALGRAWKSGLGLDGPVLPAFKAIENNAAGGDRMARHGRSAPCAPASAEVHPLTKRYLQAAQQAGLPLNPDFNGATQEGVGVYQISTRNGRRMSAARAFLRPAMKRAERSRRDECACDPKSSSKANAASASNMSRMGQKLTVRAGREVILSGGSINSPQLLQLSGDRLGRSPAVAGHRHRSRQRQCRPQPAGPCRHQLHLQGPRGDAEPDPAALVGQDAGRHAISAAALRDRSRLSMNNAGGFFRTDPSLARPNMQLYFQAFSTVIPKDGRAAYPDARPLARFLHRPLKLPSHEPWRDHDPVGRIHAIIRRSSPTHYSTEQDTSPRCSPP